MIIAANYADKRFKRTQKLNSKTALQWGADKVIEYGPNDIDEEFRKKIKRYYKYQEVVGIICGNHIFIIRRIKS